MNFKICITGTLRRFANKEHGFTRLSELRAHYSFSLNEFVKHFETTKKAFNEGDMKAVKQFFDIYV